MNDVPLVQMDYVKRSLEEHDALRRQFNSSVRSNFLKNLARDDASVRQLRAAGFSDQQIDRMREGKVPQGYNVHHKFPLDDGGDNRTENLVLIKQEPWHAAVTNAHNDIIRGMTHGDRKNNVEWPLVPGTLYPAPPR